MSFCLQARDVRAMYSYADAKRRYEKIKPARDGSRYLSRNRSLWMEQHGEEYVCIYHHNKVVTYRPDNTVLLRSCGWETPSTARFVEACTGLRCFSSRGTLYACVDYCESKPSGYFPLNGAVIEMESCMIKNPTVQQRKVLDKARAKELRAPMQPFIRDITNMAKFMDVLPPASQLAAGIPRELISGTKYVLRDVCYILQKVIIGDAAAKELVTSWVLYRAACEAITSEAAPALLVRRVLDKILHQLYVDNDCVVWEDVPLGEIPKPSRY